MKGESNPNWERIEMVMEYSGKTSIAAFSRVLELNRAENLYQIKRGNHGISKELANRISGKFPSFSTGWLLTGENKVNAAAVGIPFYEKRAVERYILREKSDKYLMLSSELCHNVKFASLYDDDAMSPYLEKGSIVLLTDSTGDILYGKIYLIVTEKYRLIRFLRKAKLKNEILLASPQPTRYDNITVRKNEIIRLYRVMGTINIFI